MTTRRLLPSQPITQKGDLPSRDMVEIIQRLVEAAGSGGGGGLSDGSYGDIAVSGSGTVMTIVATLDEIPAPVASVEFDQQQALQFVIENRTSDPGSPVAGQLWLRTDL